MKIETIIDLLLGSVKKLDEGGVRCRAYATYKDSVYHYNFFPFTNETITPQKDKFIFRLDKYSESSEGFLNYVNFETTALNLEEAESGVSDLLQIILDSGMNCYLSEESKHYH